MCGLVGIAGPLAEREATVRRMAARIAHRGPDDEGFWHDAGCALGHRRLSIIDLSPAGRQPMANEDGAVQLVWNGEIYNFAELRAELEKKGHTFRSRTDGEVIVHLYEEEGVGFVRRLRGMFAIGLWDARERRLVLARDHFGQKPLFWARVGESLIFASEAKAILACPGVDRAVDPGAVDAFLAIHFVPAPLTMWRGIRRLEAAHVLTWSPEARSEPRIEKYWSMAGVGERASRLSETEAEDELARHLGRAVREQLVADVPVGLFLSGGIDSSLIASYASDHGPLSTFTVGFHEAAYSELPAARGVASALGLANHEVILAAKDAADPASLVDIFDEPFADVAALPVMALARRARGEVKVALTGDGGDEVLGGYEHHVLARWLFGGKVRARIARTFTTWVPRDVRFGSRARRLRRAFETLAQVDAVRALRSTLIAEERALLYREDFLADLGLEGPYGFLNAERTFIPAGDRVLADRFLYKTDMAAMSVGLECRSPFLDVPLAEFVAGLPVSFKVRGLEGKWLARRLLARRLPRAVWARRKTGLTMPVEDWLRGPLAPMLHDTLLAPKARVYDYVRGEVVANLVDEHQARRENHRRILWALLLLEIWLRRAS